MTPKPLPWFFTVNERPVKMIATSDGGMDVLVLNFKTGAFERNMRYLSRALEPGDDVDELDEQGFGERVDSTLRAHGHK